MSNFSRKLSRRDAPGKPRPRMCGTTPERWLAGWDPIVNLTRPTRLVARAEARRAAIDRERHSRELNKPAAPIRLTVLRGAKNKKPTAQDDYPTFRAVADEIESLATTAVAATKHDLPAFNFGELAKPYNVNANTLRVTALAIDVDKVPDLPATLARLKEGRIEALVYESASSTDDAPRVRICAPLSRPIAPDEVKRARRVFAELLGIGPGQGVEGAEAVSQIFFVGRLEGTPQRKVWRFEGAPLDADDLAGATLRGNWKPITATALDADVDGLPAAPRICVDDYIEFLKHCPTKGVDPDAPSNARFTYCGEGARRGLNREQITEAMQAYYLPRHAVDTSDEWLHTNAGNALSHVHGNRERRNNAQGHAVLLAWEARRDARTKAKRKRPKKDNSPLLLVWSKKEDPQ